VILVFLYDGETKKGVVNIAEQYVVINGAYANEDSVSVGSGVPVRNVLAVVVCLAVSTPVVGTVSDPKGFI
jgi:hypothetical protein